MSSSILAAGKRRARRTSSRSQRQPARPYPLLKEGTDAESLEACVAFHLHRLKLTGRRLRDCGFCPTAHASDVAQGRLPLSPKDLERLAEALGANPVELSRPLTPHEAFAWSFYRSAAAQGYEVWLRAKLAWEDRGMTITAAAGVMGLDRSVVTRNTRPGNVRGYRVFPLAAANRLSRALGIREGASYFIRQD